MKTGILVRIDFDGLGSRWIAQAIADDILTASRAEARRFRTSTNAGDASGKMARLLREISAEDFRVVEEPEE